MREGERGTKREKGEGERGRGKYGVEEGGHACKLVIFRQVHFIFMIMASLDTISMEHIPCMCYSVNDGQ